MNVGSAYVQAAAVVCALLALSFGWVRVRHSDPGSGWFAAGFLSVFATFAINVVVPPDAGHTNRAASVTNLVAMLALCAGLVDFVGLRAKARWRWRLLLPSPMLIGIFSLPFGGMSRAFTQLSIAASLMLMAWLTWRASRRQRQVNLALVIAALLLQPAIALVMLLLGIDLYQLTSVVIVPVALFGMTLFAVSLTRARVLMEEALAARDASKLELQLLNESLEMRVDQRTSELQEVIGGLEAFNRSVSHDLRGPLGGVAGVSRQAIKAIQSDDKDRALRKLNLIAKQADLLGDLVHDLLLLARVGDAPLSMRAVSLDACVGEAVEQLKLAGQDVACVNVDTLPMRVDADASLLRQVFVNLIGNAIKFTRDVPDPRVRVRALPDGGAALVCIEDNGAGFESARAGELFQPFKRLHGAKFEGSGVGLTIVRRIVVRHGGRVWAESSPGEGARFYVSLPTVAELERTADLGVATEANASP